VAECSLPPGSRSAAHCRQARRLLEQRAVHSGSLSWVMSGVGCSPSSAHRPEVFGGRPAFLESALLHVAARLLQRPAASGHLHRSKYNESNITTRNVAAHNTAMSGGERSQLHWRSALPRRPALLVVCLPAA
jgi:hypothetical protein